MVHDMDPYHLVHIILNYSAKDPFRVYNLDCLNRIMKDNKVPE